MPSKHINNKLNSEAYFITMTVNKWYYIFDRHKRWQILLDSLIFAQKHKNLKVFAFVFMLNHIHLVVSTDEGNPFSDIMRDFK